MCARRKCKEKVQENCQNGIAEMGLGIELLGTNQDVACFVPPSLDPVQGPFLPTTGYSDQTGRELRVFQGLSSQSLQRPLSSSPGGHLLTQPNHLQELKVRYPSPHDHVNTTAPRIPPPSSQSTTPTKSWYTPPPPPSAKHHFRESLGLAPLCGYGYVSAARDRGTGRLADLGTPIRDVVKLPRRPAGMGASSKG